MHKERDAHTICNNNEFSIPWSSWMTGIWRDGTLLQFGSCFSTQDSAQFHNELWSKWLEIRPSCSDFCCCSLSFFLSLSPPTNAYGSRGWDAVRFVQVWISALNSSIHLIHRSSGSWSLCTQRAQMLLPFTCTAPLQHWECDSSSAQPMISTHQPFEKNRIPANCISIYCSPAHSLLPWN